MNAPGRAPRPASTNTDCFHLSCRDAQVAQVAAEGGSGRVGSTPSCGRCDSQGPLAHPADENTQPNLLQSTAGGGSGTGGRLVADAEPVAARAAAASLASRKQELGGVTDGGVLLPLRGRRATTALPR